MTEQTIDKTLELNIQKLFLSDTRRIQVDDISQKIEITGNLIHDYCSIDNPNYDTDDEIINWTFVDVIGDLISAQANLLIGHYKASASLLRNAQELSFTALFFQLKQNESQNRGVQYNSHFAKWDNGLKDSPNWGTTKPVISNNNHIKQLKDTINIDIVGDSYELYKELCSYTHNRAFDKNSQPVTNINMYKENFMGFEEDLFNRFSLLFEKTISSIITAWLVSFPEIYQVESLWCEKALKHSKIDFVVAHPRKNEIFQYLINN